MNASRMNDLNFGAPFALNKNEKNIYTSWVTGYITGSRELACQQLGYKYLTSVDILLRDKCPKETRERDNPLSIPYTYKGEKHFITPDDFDAIEYGNGAIFSPIETDMGREQHIEKIDKKTQKEKKSTTQTISGYREIIYRETYKELFGIPNFTPTYITNSISRMHNALNIAFGIASTDGKGSANNFLFQHVDIKRSHKSLPATGQMLTRDYYRIGGKTKNISKV